MRDVQAPSGRFTDIAPVGRGFGGVLWGSAGIVVPWEVYLQYKDVGLLERHYPAMAAYAAYLETTIDPKTGLSSDAMLDEMFSERKLNINDISVHVYGNAAWAEFYWDFDARLKANGSPLKTKGRETQGFRKEEVSGWRLVHVHYSGMPVSGSREGV